MNRNEIILSYCRENGVKKYAVAARLGVSPQVLSHLLRADIDTVVSRIDELAPRKTRRRAA